MLKYFLLRFKVCLIINLTAELHLVPISETLNYTSLLCAIHGNTGARTRGTNTWETVTTTIFTLHWLLREPEATVFDKDLKVRKRQCIPGPTIFSFWCQWSVIICVCEIQQGFKRVKHFSRFICWRILCTHRVFTRMRRKGTVRRRQTAGVQSYICQQVTESALPTLLFFPSAVLTIHGLK
jgi:hypothetical protein